MNLPKDNAKLEEIFMYASDPEIAGLSGEYFVDMITGLPSLRVFSHRKEFNFKDGKVVGSNILFSGWRWGRFYLEEDNYRDRKIILINYDVPENSFISNRIRDQIRCLQRGNLYLGRYNWLIGDKLKFFGFFTLTKK